LQIWLARHGETEWSLARRHTGSTDLPLTPAGERDARALRERLAGHTFGRVLSSPLTRAMETARLAGFDARLVVTDLLREYDYGDYEGLTTEQIRRVRPDWDLFRDGCPGGESPAQMSDRMDRLLAFIGERVGDVLLFAHGHCLRALAARFLERPIELADQLRLEAGSLSILGTENAHPAILLWGEVPRGE
jgi:broad specificity phosphatase PhoE